MSHPFVTSLLLLGLAGCGRETAQTAEREPESAPLLDCSSAPTAVELPQAAPFGDGKEPLSPLVGQGYGPEGGPGLFIAARDRFRVYLDDELVKEGGAPRAAEFIPLTILPGEHTLTVVVSAASGRPALLLQLDELERSYFSDARFAVSDSPSGNYRDASFDASSWAPASDVGALGTLAGCDPSGLFPAASLARWIAGPQGSSTAVFRSVIRVVPSGFGAQTTGGSGAKPVLVSTFDELSALAEDDDTPAQILLAEGVYDFRQAAREQLTCPEPCSGNSSRSTYTVLTGDETCAVDLVTRTRNERSLKLTSNKTLVGLGRGAALRGVSLSLEGENIIARNLAVFDVNPALIEAGDAFGVDTAERVWIDHCTMKWVSDGFSDVRAGSANITFSWLHYDGPSADACSGFHPRASAIVASSATVHHSFFDQVDSTSPQAEQAGARVHVYNNLLSHNPSYGVAAICGGQVLMEGNVLEAVRVPTARKTCRDDATLGLIHAPAGSNLYLGDVGAHSGGDGQEPRDAVFSPPYEYELEAPEQMRRTVKAGAGAGGPWSLPLSLQDP